MVSLAAHSTVALTALTPARCPSMRGKAALPGPATVAVHDNCNMPGQPGRAQVLDELRFKTVGVKDAFKSFH